MRRLLAYLRPYSLHVAGAILMLILASGLELVGPWLTLLAIDQAFPEADYDFLAITVTGENGIYGKYGTFGDEFDGY